MIEPYFTSGFYKNVIVLLELFYWDDSFAALAHRYRTLTEASRVHQYKRTDTNMSMDNPLFMLCLMFFIDTVIYR